MISHDESAVLRKFKCPECEKAFKFKHHLKEHIRIHSGEKPFECPNCGKRFSHSGSYSSHMTSKKCLVVNLKVRRSVDRSVRGKRNNNNNGTNNNNNNILRPIIPKYGDEHQELYMNSTSTTSSSQVTTSPVTVSTYLGHNDHFPPPAAAMLTTSYSQPSMQPFLPNPSSFSSIGLHPLLASHFHNSGVSPNPYLPSSIASSLAAMAASLPDLHHSFRYKAEDKQSERKSPSSEPDSDSKAAAAKKESNDKDYKDLKAVKKILEIVDATAKQQKCVLSEAAVADDKKEVKCETDDDRCEALESFLKCKFCDHKFESHLVLHQHERYLCHENKNLLHDSKLMPAMLKSEIKTEGTDSAMEDCKPGSSTGTGDSDDDSARDNIDEDNCNNDDGSRKWRVRSLFSEEHLHILKSFYKVNPRPKKYDVERLANQIGFATRVVQVWFQNMRARDRRRGRHIQVPYFASNGSSQGSPKSFPSSNQTVYPSLVPTYNGISSPSSLGMYYSQQQSPPPLFRTGASLPSGAINLNGQCPSPSSSPNNLPSKSSVNSLSSPGSQHGGNADDQPLDLSMKSLKDDSDDNALNLSRKSSRTSTPSRESNSSSIIDGINKSDITSKTLQKDSLASQFLSNLKSRSLLVNNDKSDLRYLQRYPPTTLSSLQHILSIPPLHPLTDHASLPPTSANSKLVRADAPSPTSYSHSEYNSDDALVIDDGSGKSISKRPWPHMDGDDSLDDDPLKQGKPWKQQKMIEGFALEDGMYSCDQCDKMFSKQSSLARHKYEHSGQRPHKCEQCGKAFKHKHHLTEHRRLHSGEKPFQCKKCLKRFSHSGSYSQHMNHRYSYCKPYRE